MLSVVVSFITTDLRKREGCVEGKLPLHDSILLCRWCNGVSKKELHHLGESYRSPLCVREFLRILETYQMWWHTDTHRETRIQLHWRDLNGYIVLMRADIIGPTNACFITSL